MTNEQLDLLRKGRFVELANGSTYAISTENDFETFALIDIDWDLEGILFEKNNFDDDFKCTSFCMLTNPIKRTIYDINKIATDVELNNIIWERKE